MHAFIDSYLTTAIEQNAPWLAAVGTPGDDPRRVQLWNTTVREIAVSRVVSGAPDDEPDPLAYLSGARREAIVSRIERLTAPTTKRRQAKAASPYGRYTDAELAAARRSSLQRLGEDRRLLALAEQELARVSGTDSAVSAVDQRVAEAEHQDRQIQNVRSARTHLDLLRHSGTATAQQLADATTAVSAAEAAAPPERDWPIVERSAQFNRAAAARYDRARVLDDQAIGRVTDRITRLGEGLRTDHSLLEQIDAEIARRRDGGTRPGSDPQTKQPEPHSPTRQETELDPSRHERGPNLDL
ncbi:hypothetical protein LZP97_26420 (plasmid) [Rhodococcus sp. DMF-1]|uniref:hypothetical protein n=1 Tax=Rhodococcus sp. DMF-1 TaxID=2907624 RepID=UPI001F48CE2A|nr:hypothetical protein [Rhodococcus sp. DMF-1]UIR39718.1 hypothetical protein LZP97_26420 [Rhodococcus sp. DMF-1]